MIMHRPDPTAAIRSLRSAAPYIRMYKGKTFVVKAGGGVFADPAAVRGLIEQIAILHYFGVRVVFVHGGGPQLTEITEALGVPTRMVQGRRVTDQKAIDATAMWQLGVRRPAQRDEGGVALAQDRARPGARPLEAQPHVGDEPQLDVHALRARDRLVVGLARVGPMTMAS